MRTNTSTVVMFFDVTLETKSQNVSGFTSYPALYYMQQIEELFGRGKASRDVDKKRATIYIVDMRIDRADGLVYVLLNKSNKDEPDVVYTNSQTRSSRVIVKDDGEGLGSSAHVVMSLESVGGRYACVMEKAKGLSFAAVSTFISSLLKGISEERDGDYRRPHPSGVRDKRGDIKAVKTWCKFVMIGHISNELKDELRKGRLLEIELIKKPVRKEYLDGDELYEFKSEKIKYAPVRQVWDKLESIKQSFSGKSDQYKNARIAFRRADGERDAIVVGTEFFDLESSRYVKSKTINLPERIAASDGEINHQIVKAMKAELLRVL